MTRDIALRNVMTCPRWDSVTALRNVPSHDGVGLREAQLWRWSFRPIHRSSGSCRISLGDIAPMRWELLSAQLARPLSRFAGGSHQNFHAGFASIEATKKKNAATPTASMKYPVAAPSPTTTSRKQTNDPGGLRSRSMVRLWAFADAKSISASS
jgi:hypothetical protein